MSVSEKKPRRTTRVAVAGPGALASVLLIGAVAFGASSLRGPSADAADPDPRSRAAEPKPSLAIIAHRTDGPDHAAKPDPKPTAKPKASVTPKDEKPKDEANDKPKDEAKAEAPKPAEKPADKPKADAPKAPDKPKATAKPKPAPTTPTALILEGWTKETKVKLAWKAYAGEGFEYYKVVRSTDATVTWPAGAGDTVIGVIGDPKAPWWADKPACGVASSYRVFAVRSGEGGYVTLGASNLVTVTVPCAPEPTPHETKPIGLTVQPLTGEGMKLTWDACAVDGFIAYKVVRSLTNPDPRYPLNDGTELIAAIGDPGQTQLLDPAVTAGQTWTYRVLAVGEGSDGKIVLCQSAAVAATAP